MSKKEFNKLVDVYGMDKAEKAWAWFIENYNESFRKSVHPALFCMNNEYLWNTNSGPFTSGVTGNAERAYYNDNPPF